MEASKQSEKAEPTPTPKALPKKRKAEDNSEDNRNDGSWADSQWSSNASGYGSDNQWSSWIASGYGSSWHKSAKTTSGTVPHRTSGSSWRDSRIGSSDAATSLSDSPAAKKWSSRSNSAAKVKGDTGGTGAGSDGPPVETDSEDVLLAKAKTMRQYVCASGQIHGYSPGAQVCTNGACLWDLINELTECTHQIDAVNKICAYDAGNSGQGGTMPSAGMADLVHKIHSRMILIVKLLRVCASMGYHDKTVTLGYDFGESFPQKK